MRRKRLKQFGTKLYGRSKITNGTKLLPSVHGKTTWGRIFGDTYHALVTHCGGLDTITEPERMIARRAAALEPELILYENSIGMLRVKGKEPDPVVVDRYGRLAERQRRFLETLGFERRSRDVTPSLDQYLARNDTEPAEAAE